MATLEQAQADLPRQIFQSGRGGAELFDAELIADADFFATVVPPASNQLQAYNGASWVNGTLKRWDGNAWVTAVLKQWSGTAWVTL